MRTVDADKLMERAKMHSILVSPTLGHFDYGLTLGMLNEIVKECETSAPVGDMVSRQAVLNLLSSMPPEEAITQAMLILSVKQMAAAQSEVIRCKDCKCWRELPSGCQGFCDVHSAYPTLTDFCSWAERREESE